MNASTGSRPTLWRTCRVLANERRLQMLAHLVRDPWQTVSAITDQMQLSLPAVSLYLRALEARGFLQVRRTGRHVKYHLAAGTDELSTAFNAALRAELGEPANAQARVFKLITSFTHPRRIELVRSLATGPKTALELCAATRIPLRALSRHLHKLRARGLISRQATRHELARPPGPLAAALVNLATG
jgi:DNA-binding transcriptional ArsR family regulator